MELLEQIPPNNVEAEQAVLGAMLASPEATDKASEILSESDFYRQAHGIIYSAILKASRGGYSQDLIGVSTVLRELGELEDCGGYKYLMDLMESIPSASNAAYYAKLVKKAANHRKVITFAQGAIEKAFAGDMDDPLGWLSAEAMSISDKQTRNDVKRIVDVAMAVVDAKNAAKAATVDGNGHPDRIMSGWQSLDNLTQGFGKGNMITVAARPSVGKSAFALQLSANIAKRGNPVMIFSAEMSAEELVNRLACSWSGVSASRVLSGDIHGQHDDAFDEAAAMIAKLPIAIEDDSDIHIGLIASRARRFKAENGGKLGAIVVDYLQLLGGIPDTKRTKANPANRNEEVSQISRGLKNLASSLGCPVIALSQLNREVEKRPGGKPQLSDLRDSGSIEQDSNMVLFLYHGEGYDIEAGQGQIWIDIAKNRGGRRGRVSLNFDGSTTTFTDPLDVNVWHQNERVRRGDIPARQSRLTPVPEAQAEGTAAEEGCVVTDLTEWDD